MTDPKLEALDEQIKELNNKRIARIMELQDPNRALVKEKYEQVATLFKELENLGESLTDGNLNGLNVVGTFFEIDRHYNVEEVF